MKTLELKQMEELEGGSWWSDNSTFTPEQQAGCAVYGLAAGIASGLNPIVGGLTTLGCFLLL